MDPIERLVAGLAATTGVDDASSVWKPSNQFVNCSTRTLSNFINIGQRPRCRLKKYTLRPSQKIRARPFFFSRGWMKCMLCSWKVCYVKRKHVSMKPLSVELINLFLVGCGQLFSSQHASEAAMWRYFRFSSFVSVPQKLLCDLNFQ